MRSSSNVWLMVIALIIVLIPSATLSPHRQIAGAATAVVTPAATAAANPCTTQPFIDFATSADVETAVVKQSAAGGDSYTLSITLTDSGAARVSEFTGKHIGQPIAVVLNGKVLNVVTVQAAVSKAFDITGGFTQQTAQALAAELASGPLPAPVTLLSQDDIEGGTRLTIQVGNGAPVAPSDMDQTKSTMSRRLSALGIDLPDVAYPEDNLANGNNNRVIVTLPGAADENSTETASLAVQSTGLLELVDFSRSESCHAEMPFAGQYVLTDVQIARSRPHAPPSATPAR